MANLFLIINHLENNHQLIINHLIFHVYQLIIFTPKKIFAPGFCDGDLQAWALGTPQ